MATTLTEADKLSLSNYFKDAAEIEAKNAGIHVNYVESDSVANPKQQRDMSVAKLLLKAAQYKTPVTRNDFLRNVRDAGKFGLMVPEKSSFKAEFLNDLRNNLAPLKKNAVDLETARSSDLSGIGAPFGQENHQPAVSVAHSPFTLFGAQRGSAPTTENDHKVSVDTSTSTADPNRNDEAGAFVK